MAVETLQPGVNLLQQHFRREEPAVIVEGLALEDYIQRACMTEYHSRLFLLPRDLSNQYKEYLKIKGLSESQISEKMEYTYAFFKEREQVLQGQITIDDSLYGEEEQLLGNMYRQAVNTIQSETLREQEGKYVLPEGRIYAGDTFISNFFEYSQDQRMQILEDLGYKKEGAKKIAIGLGTAIVSTIALQALEGPGADFLGVSMGRLGNIQDIGEKIREMEPVMKWLATAGIILGSAAGHYLTTFAKTIQTLRAIREESYYGIPNAVVAADAIISHRTISPKENNLKLHWKLFKRHMMSPWVLWDEKWNFTLLIPDHGITYAMGNVISTALNTAQIAFMEAAIQYSRFRKRREAAGLQNEKVIELDPQLDQAQLLLRETEAALKAEFAQVVFLQTNEVGD